ncbi:alpha/beta hydrolase domain-containing protein, partial [Streptomyces sp. NPDC002920]
MEPVIPASLRRSPDDGSATFAPYGTHVPSLDTYDYVEEEWIATGEEDGHTYATTVLVRRPRDRARFSGTVVAEPLHVHGIAPIWIYSGPYILRSGHAWVEITAQKTTLDLHVKASNPQRYESLHIEGPDSADFDLNVNLGDREHSKTFFAELVRRNRATSTILAQVGAALRSPEGPFAGTEPAQVVLAGHSQTGWVTTSFIDDTHDVLRLADGSPVYDGFFPSGFPL